MNLFFLDSNSAIWPCSTTLLLGSVLILEEEANSPQRAHHHLAVLDHCLLQVSLSRGDVSDNFEIINILCLKKYECTISLAEVVSTIQWCVSSSMFQHSLLLRTASSSHRVFFYQQSPHENLTPSLNHSQISLGHRNQLLLLLLVLFGSRGASLFVQILQDFCKVQYFLLSIFFCFFPLFKYVSQLSLLPNHYPYSDRPKYRNLNNSNQSLKSRSKLFSDTITT